jgi:hypothetical protein
MIISPSPLYRARRELEIYWRKVKATGTDINALATGYSIVALQQFLEGFYNIVDPDKVTEIFTFRKNQNAGTTTDVYGLRGKFNGTLGGSADYRSGDDFGVNLPDDTAEIAAPGMSLSYAPCSIIQVLSINNNSSRCRCGHTGGYETGFFAHHNFWTGGAPTRGFGALRNAGGCLVVPSSPGDGFIPLASAPPDPEFHSV